MNRFDINDAIARLATDERYVVDEGWPWSDLSTSARVVVPNLGTLEVVDRIVDYDSWGGTEGTTLIFRIAGHEEFYRVYVSHDSWDNTWDVGYISQVQKKTRTIITTEWE